MPDDQRLALITSGTGRKVYVEVSSAAQPILRQGGPGFAPAGAGAALEECFESLEQAIDSTCEIIFDGVTRMAKRASPSKVSSEFSFELGAEGKIWFLAKGNVKATIKVTVEWDLAHGSSLAGKP
jgi:Trypsin-co-occurring domain 1